MKDGDAEEQRGRCRGTERETRRRKDSLHPLNLLMPDSVWEIPAQVQAQKESLENIIGFSSGLQAAAPFTPSQTCFLVGQHTDMSWQEAGLENMLTVTQYICPMT
jgi:hypothetical protein